MADWNHYEAFVNATDEIFNYFEKGLLLLCNTRSEFYQCLGLMYSSCTSRFYFLRHGYSQSEAAAFTEIFKELEFMCAGGILQSINHWKCIEIYKKSSDQTYNKCLAQYHANVEKDPSQICRAAFSMALCARMPYNVHCGNEVGWWECERVRIALDIDSYCPTLNCYYSLGEKYSVKKTRKQKLQENNPYFMSAGII
ncbi:unnamed protein product [Enterobius vermicularis]|uniref:DUF19 domain-containing protein n=1 Tax=Enterobius vermicularis TaxID=51028 RepID=A0A0N4V179_ENTVE|nr:unnamed protein product [Enterobius vermicularis]